MTQRKTYSRSSSTYNRTNTARKAPPKKYNYSPNKTPKPPQRKNNRRSGGNIIWVFLVIILAVVGIFVGSKVKSLYSDNNICKGITIDGTDVSGMSYENALTLLNQKNQQKLDSISINLHYLDKSWQYDATKLQATIDTEDVLNTVIKLGHEGTVTERLSLQKEISSQGRAFNTSIKVDEQVLINALDEIRSNIDNAMVEGHIEFDPTNYDFFEDKNNPDVDMSRSMFNIISGKVGFDMDYEGAKNQIYAALQNGYKADITITAEQRAPKFTQQVLEECTTLIYHSDSEISTKNRKDDNRNYNLAKALSYYKGLVVMPGDVVSYNDTLGIRDERNGWKLATTIAQDKSYKKDYGGGICQVATAIFNAAYMAGAEIIQNNPHSYCAYSGDFGYAMDAMVNWGTSDFVFTNNTEYPMFFNTYMYMYSDGRPLYVDVDVYTMPQKDEQGNVLHIRSEAQQIDTQPPAGEPEYIEDVDNEFADKTWRTDTTLNQQVYVHIKPRNMFKYDVYRVWYSDCVQTDMGKWEGGTEVKRERSHTYTYDSVRGKIYTKPIPAPTAAPPAEGDAGASG